VDLLALCYSVLSFSLYGKGVFLYRCDILVLFEIILLVI